MNYYNEFDPFAASWLRELIKQGHIPKGDVDDRSIEDVRADDLKGYTQCHFFAGIGGWSYALQLAGWESERPVWTGSCPCQPFSSAGKQKGKADERHLWPVWHRLIRECRPPTIFGEQVASAVAHGWLDDVYQGLEPEGYAIGAAVLPACSVGAPHKRDRLWFVANAQSERSGGAIGASGETLGRSTTGNGLQLGGTGHECSHVADAAVTGFQDGRSTQSEQSRQIKQPERFCGDGNVADTSFDGRGQSDQNAGRGGEGISPQQGAMFSNDRSSTVAHAIDAGSQGHGQLGDQPIQEGRQGTERHPWESGLWINCPDGKQRLVEPTVPLLAHGIPNRVGKLRGYGNAIVPQVAAIFIEAYSETLRPDIRHSDLI